jgi:Sec-independent protein secretion pathway component TatC
MVRMSGIGLEPLISVSDYFDLFVEVMVGIGLIFELPVLILLLTLLHVVTPAFLARNSRYAIMLIVIVAALVTPDNGLAAEIPHDTTLAVCGKMTLWGRTVSCPMGKG